MKHVRLIALVLLLPAAPTLAEFPLLVPRFMNVVELAVNDYQEHITMCDKVKASPKRNEFLIKTCHDDFIQLAEQIDRYDARVMSYKDDPALTAAERTQLDEFHARNSKVARDARARAEAFQ